MIYTQEERNHIEPDYHTTHWSIMTVIIVAPFLLGFAMSWLVYKTLLGVPTYPPPRHILTKVLTAKKTPANNPDDTAGASATLTPSPTKRPPSKWGSAASEYLQQTFGKQAATAMQIINEHHRDCAYGKGTRYVGLFAIDTIAEGLSQEQAQDCYTNIDAAKKIYQREGFKPWGK